MNLSKLKNLSKWFYAFLGMGVALVAAIIAIIVISVNANKGPDAPTDLPDGPETGVYYYDVSGGEVLLSLNSGNKFTIAGPDINKSGDYTVSDETITLDFVRDEDGTAEATLSGNTVTLTYNNATMTFLKKVSYTVTFNPNGGSAVAAVTVVNGKTAAKPQDPTKENNVFLGWYTDEALTTPFSFDATAITANTTIYARWTAKAPGQNEYVAKLELGYDGATLDDMTTLGGKLIDVPTPVRDGYTFAGWYISMYEDGDMLSYAYTEDMVLDANTTLFAVWTDDASTKLDAPGVSVSDSAVKWNAVEGASGYKIVITSADEVVLEKSIGATTQTFNFDELPAGDYKIEVTAVSPNTANNSEIAVRYFKNKALPRVSSFQVIDGVLVFGVVENAEKYFITIDCGNDAHKHTMFDNGNSTNYNFSNCPMQAGGIKFTVTAVANGYASSVSETFVYDRTLAAIGNVSYNAETDTFVWNAVTNAASYSVTVTVADSSYTFDIGNKTSFSVAGYTGQIEIAVTPVTKGYNSPAAATGTCTKTAPATPAGLKVNGMILSWDLVEGATSYEVKIGSSTYPAETNSFDLATVELNAGTSYAVSVKTIKDTESSAYSTAVNVGYYVMNPNLTYKNNTVYWTPVIGVTNYEVRVNGGDAIAVSGASEAKVVLTKAGTNTIEVRYTDNGGSAWISIDVTAYGITYKSRSLGGERTEYVAIGDTLTLPTDFVNNGYTFTAWYNSPNASEGNGVKFEAGAVFEGNSDTVLYADWAPNTYKIELQVDGFGITNIQTGTTVDATYTYSFTLPVPETDDENGIFVGWYTGPSGTGDVLTDENGNSYGAYPYYRDTPAYPFFNKGVLSFSLRSDNTYAVKAGPNFDLATSITIPATYNGLPVTVILENAFASRKNLVTINIPDTINLVGTGAFTGNTMLEEINVYRVEGNHERKYSSYDGALIREDMGTTFLEVFPRAKTGEYEVPDGVEVIRSRVFQYASIDKLVISSSVETISYRAFYVCDELVTIEFEGGRTTPLTLESGIFYACDNILTIKLPANINEIDTSIFDSLDKLANIEVEEGGSRYGSVNGMLTNAIEDTILYAPTTVSGSFTVPQKINYIGDGAFKGREGITQVIIPNHTLGIGVGAFRDCPNIESVTVKGRRVDDLEIGASAFAGCTRLRSVNFEGSGNANARDRGAITIGASAFASGGSSVLTGVTFADGVNIKSVGANAFANQTNLYNLKLGENIGFEEIGDGAFMNNTALSAIAIPASTKTIGASAFKGCTGITEVTFTEGGDEISFGASAFENCTRLTSIYLPSTVSAFKGNVFAGCQNLSEIVVAGTNPNLMAIDGVLYGIDADRNPVTLLFYPKALAADPEALAALPWDTITMIGESVFADNSKVTEFIITKELTAIGDGAFSGCKELTTVTVEDGGTALTVGADAFRSCTKLSSMSLPAYTTSIGSYAFASTSFDETTFTMPTSLKTIGSYAFYGNSSITTIDIPAGVTSIGAGAFSGCSNLATVNVAESTTNITLGVGVGTGGGVFNSCTKLSEIDFKNRVTEISDYAFYGSGLTSIVLDSKVTSIGAYAFANTSKLESIHVPATVTYIGSYAFNSTALASIEFEPGGDADLEFGDGVFRNTAITTITLPKRVTKLHGKITTSSYNGVEVSNIADQFAGAANLGTINVEAGSTSFASVDGVLYETDNSGVPVTLLYCPPLNEGRVVDGVPTYEIIVPKTVTLVENRAFKDVTAITTVTFEEYAEDDENYGMQLLSIGNGSAEATGTSNYPVFAGSSITKISFPSHLAKLASNAVKLTAGVTLDFNTDASDVVFGYQALYDLTIEGDLDLPGIGYMGENLFNSTTFNGTFAFNENNSFDTIESRTFAGSNLTSIEIPASVKYLDAMALWQMHDLTSVSFAEGSQLESIGVQAFCYDELLTDIDFTNATKLESIGSYAFGSTGFESFTFPESVKSVGSYPFQACEYLTSITLSETFTAAMLTAEDINSGTVSALGWIDNLAEIRIDGDNSELSVADGVLYDKLQTILYCFPIAKDPTGFKIPDTVKRIENSAFEGFTGTGLELPAGLEYIGKSAFSDSSLESIFIPAEVTTIGEHAFYYSENMKSVTFAPNSKLTSIGEGAFGYLELVESFVIPDGVTTIGESAFYGCFGLKEIILPAALETIGTNAFQDCSALTSVTIQENVTSIGDEAFMNTGIKSVVIPAKVTSIGASAFADATKLVTVEFAKGSKLETIGASAFENCTALQSIVIPETVTSIGTEAFMNATSLTSATLPSKLEVIANNLFSGATKLESVNIPETAVSIGNSAFAGTSIKSADIPATVTTIGTSAFANCASLESVVFPEGSNLTVLGANETGEDSIFKNTPALTTVVLPTNLKEIGGHVFENSGVANIYLPASLTSIGDYAFANCDNITSAAVYGEVLYLGDYAFFDCDGLSSVELSFGLEYLGALAFGSCEKLTAAYIPATVIRLGGNPYGGTSAAGITLDPDNRTFLLDEDGALYDMSKMTLYYYPASNVTEDVVLPDTVEEIAAGAFAGATMKSITVPAKVAQIKAYTFFDCDNLETVVIENGITTIGNHAFDGCDKLNNVAIPASATTLGDYAFANCTSLSSVTFDASARYTIGTHFFDGCTAMTEIILPTNHQLTDADAREHGCTTTAKKQGAIPSYMFANSGIVNAVVPSSIIELGTTGVFMNCKAMESITFDGKLSYQSIGNYYFYGCSAITEIEIPAGGSDPLNNSIGYSFAYCTSLKKVTINYTPAIFGRSFRGAGHMFEGCTSLTEVVYQKATASSSGGGGFTPVFPGLGTLSAQPLAGIIIGPGIGGDTGGATSYTYETAYLSNIGPYYFAGCTSLEALTVANGAHIYEYAFAGCTALRSLEVYLPEEEDSGSSGGGLIGGIGSLTPSTPSTGEEAAATLNRLGDYAFRGCTAFETLDLAILPENVGVGVFDGWTVAQIINLADAQADIDNQIKAGMFKGCEAIIYDKDGNLIDIDPATGLLR